MKNKVGILILHGIGLQKKDYSIKLQQGVEEKLNGSATQVVFREVLYADLFDDYARKRSQYLIDCSFKWQFILRSLRRLLIYVFGDALSYKDKDGYIEVHKYLSDEIAALKQQLDPDSPIIVVTHSLGAMLISDYVYDEQKGINQTGFKKTEIGSCLRAFISFGCNIPAFEMGHKKTISITKPGSQFVWQNFFSPFDALGYRIAEYYEEEYQHFNKPPEFISDYRIFPGGLLTFWNIFSHLGYWSNNKIHAAIAEVCEDL